MVVAHLATSRITLLRRFLIPPSLTAGLFLLLLGPELFGLLPPELYAAWRTWPGFLISFLFVGIIFGERMQRSAGGSIARDVARQTLFVWFIGVTEIAVGLGLVLLLLGHWGTPAIFGHIIEIGWIGGHGAAGAFAARAAALGQPAAGTLAIFSATVGLVVGGTLGLVLVNHLRRRHAPEIELRPSADVDDHVSPGSVGPRIDEDGGRRIGKGSGVALSGAGSGGKSDRVVAEPLLLAMLLFVVAVLVAYAFLEGLQWGLAVLGQPGPREFFAKFPLFSVALLAAVGLRPLLRQAAVFTDDIARESGRLTGIVLEALIVSATATLQLSGAAEHLAAFMLLMLVGALWSVVLLLIFARQFLPADRWLELGVLNYGMSTGITAVGLMLVQSLRGSVTARTARIYGLAAPFSAPLIGGGAISLLLPEATATGHGWLVLGGLLGTALLLWVAGRLLGRHRSAG